MTATIQSEQVSDADQGGFAGRAELSPWCRIAAVTIFAFATLVLQHLSGAFTHMLGGAPDEAAHFMTGLMIHDYVVSGAKTPPMDFAIEYYGHYPKIAFGIWPPLFHAVEAGWMLLVSPSKVSVLTLLAGVTVLLAFMLFRSVERQFGFAAGIWAGLLLISTPLMQINTTLVMVDSSVALFCFLAIVRFGRYLDHGRWQDSALFGVWASAAILSKYNGLALAFVPIFCALLTGQWRMFRLGRTWLSAGIVLVICGAWYIPMRHLIAYAAEPLPNFSTVVPMMLENTIVLAGAMGVPLLLVSVAGMLLMLFGSGEAGARRGLWAASAALIVSCWLFHSITGALTEARYMLPALAPLVLFLVAGVYGLSRWLHRPPVQLAIVLSVVYAVGSFRVVPTPQAAYAEIASAITSRQNQGLSIILADGDANNEGMAFSEIALRERRPGTRYVLRGSKLLASMTWMGQKYQSLYHTPGRVLEALDAAGVSVVILQANAPPDVPHHGLLREALHSATDTWQRWSDTAWSRSEKDLLVYRRTRPVAGPACFEISLEETMHLRLPICVPAPAAEP